MTRPSLFTFPYADRATVGDTPFGGTLPAAPAPRTFGPRAARPAASALE
jgi:hypothetical protein